MICIAGNMPVIQVGDYQVTNYDTFWIRQAIQGAADSVQHAEFAFVDDIYEGIVYYLENQCSLRLLKLESLYERIRHMLKRIGCESIAYALQIEAPPVTISLEKAAIEAGNGYELTFYQILQDQMHGLKKLGAKEVFFDHIRESIMVLKQSQEWNHDCEQLEQDIMLWLRREGTKPKRFGYRIRCELAKLKIS